MAIQGEQSKQTGRIFDIQKFSIHDGPGIRTIVFLKGCALRCRWCCNPESQSFDKQTMLLPDGKQRLVGQDITADEVMREVLKDMPYFRRSDGGLTLSGGEALLQPDFASALLFLAKRNGINTAIESTAFGPFSEIKEKILPWLDFFLMDIKHMDNQKHLEFTGQPNIPLLENAELLARHAKNLIIRVPVVPGFNDKTSEIAAIAKFAASLPGMKRLHLLPFHKYGEDKYGQLGLPNLMQETRPPSAEYMQILKETASKSGLEIQIGG